MNKCGCCLSVLIFIAVVVVDVVFFLSLLSQYDTQETSVTTTDMIPINRKLSTFWCDGVTVKSSLEFDAFKLPSNPIVQDGIFENYSSNFTTSLSKKEYTLHKFYLLQGSSIKVSLCAYKPRAYVSVFTSMHDAKKCLKSRRKAFEDDDFELEDINCRNSLVTYGITTDSDCRDSDWNWVEDRRRGMDTVNENAYKTDHYYILIQNFYDGPKNNKIQMEINVTRTLYNVQGSSGKCTNTKECYLSFNFMSNEHVVAQALAPTQSQKFISTTIYSYCAVNVLILLVVFLAGPAILFLLLCCSVCCLCQNKKSKKKEKGHIEERGQKPTLGSMDGSFAEDSVFLSNSVHESQKNYGTNQVLTFDRAPSQQNAPTAPAYYYPPPQYSAQPQYSNLPAVYPNPPPYPQQQSQEPMLPYKS